MPYADPIQADAYRVAYRAKNAVRIRERVKQWRIDNPEQARANGRSKERVRRARKHNAFVEHVDELVLLERYDGVCGICGEDVDPMSFHVDHIVALANGGEHSYANTQPAHAFCNISKGAR